MKYPQLAFACAVSLGLIGCSQAPTEDPALAGDWTLDGSESSLSFTTVKASRLAEAHRFESLSGAVSADGAATLAIDLSSVNTGIDIRNERMREMLFQVAEFAQANVAVQLDPTAFAAMQSGDRITQTVDATLDLHGVQGEIATDLVVTRAGADKVLVQTASPIIIDASTYGLAEGVEQLREVAGLDSITPQVPVTFSLTFTRDAGE